MDVATRGCFTFVYGNFLGFGNIVLYEKNKKKGLNDM